MLNIQIVAKLLEADRLLEDLERTLKREHDRRTAGKAAQIRTMLQSALAVEQATLRDLLEDLQTNAAPN